MNLAQIVRRQESDLQTLVKQGRTPNRKTQRFIEARLNVPLHRFRDHQSYMETGCKRVWATYRAMHIKASTILSTRFAVRQEGVDDNVLDNAGSTAKLLAKLLRYPNPYDSWEEMIYQWVFHVGLTGNAYWVKDQINSSGRPKYIYPLLPQFVSLIPDERKKISHYVYKVNGTELKFSPEEIIHFRRPHPCNMYFGMGEIEPSEALFNAFINRDTFEEKFIENGAAPSGLLTYKGVGGEEGPSSLLDLDQDEWSKLKDWWQAEYAGKHNAGKTAMLTGEWSYQRLGLTHIEMESLEKEKYTVEQIFMNHGIPGSIAGIEKAANFATARQDEINFRRFEIVPLLDLLQGKLNADGNLITNYHEDWKLRYNLSGLIDVKAVWDDYAGLLKMGGMTLNEVREKMGLQRVDDPALDEYYTEQTRIPLDMSGTQIMESDLPGDNSF